jgi:hypothetical protein
VAPAGAQALDERESPRQYLRCRRLGVDVLLWQEVKCLWVAWAQDHEFRKPPSFRGRDIRRVTVADLCAAFRTEFDRVFVEQRRLKVLLDADSLA